MIKTSVIIPVYNTSLYLEECIDSVFQQTQKEIEVIAINDGSTDDSLEKLLFLQKRYPELIIMTQENRGLGYTRNVGIKRARGQYIYFLDSDDYILKDTLATCYEYAFEKRLDVVLFDAFVFDSSIEKIPIEPNNCDRHKIIEERKEIFSGRQFLEKYYQKTYHPEACLVYCSLDFIKKNNISFLPRVYFEDNEFYCRIMTLSERVMYIPKMFYQYRCRVDSITGKDFDLRRARDHIKVIRAIIDLKFLKGGGSWPAIKQISFRLLQHVAFMCNNNALYDEDRELSGQIIDTWMEICGDTINNTADITDIDYIYRLCSFFPKADVNDQRRMIEDRRNQLLIRILKWLPLDQQESRIAIYGCGKYTDKVWDFYKKWIGVIKADVIFLDSYVKNNNTKYKECTIYPVTKIGEKELDYILISSPQYEEEMCGIIRQLYGNRYKTISLYGDLHINM